MQDGMKALIVPEVMLSRILMRIGKDRQCRNKDKVLQLVYNVYGILSLKQGLSFKTGLMFPCGWGWSLLLEKIPLKAFRNSNMERSIRREWGQWPVCKRFCSLYSTIETDDLSRLAVCFLMWSHWGCVTIMTHVLDAQLVRIKITAVGTFWTSVGRKRWLPASTVAALHLIENLKESVAEWMFERLSVTFSRKHSGTNLEILYRQQ